MDAKQIDDGGLFSVVTRIQFPDRIVGQCLHVGNLESCESVANLISAISYSGDDANQIEDSRLMTVPQSDIPFEQGQKYCLPRPASTKSE